MPVPPVGDRGEPNHPYGPELPQQDADFQTGKGFSRATKGGPVRAPQGIGCTVALLVAIGSAAIVAVVCLA